MTLDFYTVSILKRNLISKKTLIISFFVNAFFSCVSDPLEQEAWSTIAALRLFHTEQKYFISK
jgi:hypothetical protein